MRKYRVRTAKTRNFTHLLSISKMVYFADWINITRLSKTSFYCAEGLFSNWKKYRNTNYVFGYVYRIRAVSFNNSKK